MSRQVLLAAQADLRAAVLRLTLPKGVDPFVELPASGNSHADSSIQYSAGFEITQAIDRLIGGNYPPFAVWEMTPRQVAGTLYFRPEA
jgi:hypothetical protein